MPDINQVIDDIVGVVDANTTPMQPDSVARPQIGQNLAQRRKYTEWSEFPRILDEALEVAVETGRLERVDGDDGKPRYRVP